MPFTKQPNAEPIPGYQLIAPLGCGGFGEVWKCSAPGGLFKAIKFVYGNMNGVGGDTSQAHEELRAIQHVKDIRHPFLLSMDRVECVNGELMIVTELADRNLHDVYEACLAKGHSGIPRDELLRYLDEAAEVLDLMNVQHGLQHLDVKPRNFFLVSNHIKVGDFGLVTSLFHVPCPSSGGERVRLESVDIKLGAVTPLYASPEVFQGKVSSSSDQYSLACCYLELLTGFLPFDGSNSRQLLLLHLNAEPDLSLLSDADRPVVARALAKDPQARYPSCQDFIRALKASQTPGCKATPVHYRTVSVADARDGAAPDRDAAAEAQGQALTQTPSGRLADNDTDCSLKGMPVLPPALAGYKLLENQGSSLLADVWKAAAPDGRIRQIKFVYGFTGRAEAAIRRLQSLQHPALPPSEVVQSGPGWLVFVNDYGNQTVRERWQKCQSLNLPGIPRLELIGYLRTVAEGLDYLYQQHSLHHLGLNPRVLLLADSGLQVADFGLAHLLWVPDGQPVAQRNPRYAPPELFERQVHRASDQYSLAIIYHEMLTGTHPFSDKDGAVPGISRAGLKPNLDPLPEQDRAAIAMALAADPRDRWPSCLDLVRALEENDDNNSPPEKGGSDALHEVVGSSHQPPLPPVSGTAEDLQQMLTEIIALAGGTVSGEDFFGLPRLSEAGDELQQKFRLGLPIGATRLRVDDYRQQCHGELLGEDEQSYVFHVAGPTSFLQQWMGHQPGLEIHVMLTRPHALSATPIDVTVTVKAVRCGRSKAEKLIQLLGGNLLEGLRTFLLVNSEKRTHDRLLWPHPVEVCAVDEDGTVGPPIQCRGKDISLGGIAFYLPQELPTSQVLIRLAADPNREPLLIPATLVRAQRCGDGWYDVGAIFRLAALCRSNPELFAASR
jgi:serine/threonine protein kinase